jgi:parallel beta-helix repeat protein
VVQGNDVGVTSNGLTAVVTGPRERYDAPGRQDVGILIDNAGATPTAGVRRFDATPNPLAGGNFIVNNIVSGNLLGIEATGAIATGNTIRANVIGASAAGDTGNGTGMLLFNAPSNLVSGNYVLRNILVGVAIVGGPASGNQLIGNTIRANGAQIRSDDPAKGTTLDSVSTPFAILPDDSKDPARNLVGTGLYIEAALGNGIGFIPTGKASVDNPNRSTDPNVIAANRLVGVYLYNNADRNTFQRNQVVGNGVYGALLFNSATNLDEFLLTGTDQNTVRGGSIASFREFTGRPSDQPINIVPGGPKGLKTAGTATTKSVLGPRPARVNQ